LIILPRRLCFSEASAAVKSLAWSPHNPEVLVTGAGTADRCLRVYNTASGTLLATNHTGSQVSSVHWSRSHQELVSTHGFSTNAVKVWQYPSLRETASLEGHRERIITSALSPDGSTLCTASADETLRFWRLWDPVAPAAAAGAYSTTTSGVLVQTLGREHSDGGRGSTGSGRFPGSSAALKRHYGSIVGGSIETENDHAGLR
jgi:cell division cycle 20-like protein 1 (cofactor of APC complex)